MKLRDRIVCMAAAIVTTAIVVAYAYFAVAERVPTAGIDYEPHPVSSTPDSEGYERVEHDSRPRPPADSR